MVRPPRPLLSTSFPGSPPGLVFHPSSPDSGGLGLEQSRGLVVAAQPVVDEQGHHVAVAGALLERPALRVLAGLGAGGVRDRLVSGRAAVLAADRRGRQEVGAGAGGCELRLRGLEREALVVGGRAVGAGLLGVDLPQHHQAQRHQPALGLALLRLREMHADFGGVHNPGAALLGPDGHVGAHGGGLSRDLLEGEDLRLRPPGGHPGEGEPLRGQSRAAGASVHVGSLWSFLPGAARRALYTSGLRLCSSETPLSRSHSLHLIAQVGKKPEKCADCCGCESESGAAERS